MDAMSSIMKTAASGMSAQQERMKVISENIANANSTGDSPGADAYRRKTVSFKQMVDEKTGAQTVAVDRISEDKSDFKMKYDPAHVAANADGYVKTPNVNTLIEMNDMREALASHKAGISTYEAGKTMRKQMIDMLR